MNSNSGCHPCFNIFVQASVLIPAMVTKNIFVPGNLQFYSDVPANISLDFSAKFPPILLIGS